MTRDEYSSHLTHPEWIKKRDHILAKYGRQCSKCGEINNLEVHHKTYSEGKLPWEYPDENFLVLCEKCHMNHHGIEYIPKYCLQCSKKISAKFTYCLDCHNKLIESKEKEIIELEGKITNLEDLLKKTNSQNNQDEINKLKREIDLLKKDKESIEKSIPELKKTDNVFREEVKQNIKNIESKISELVKEKTNKNNLSQDRQRNLEQEIEKLREKMRELENVLKESKKIEEINKSVKESHKKLESRINYLMTVLGVIAVIVILAGMILFLLARNNYLESKDNKSTVIIREIVSTPNNTIDNSKDNKKVNDLNIDKKSELSSKQSASTKSNKQERNKNLTSPLSFASPSSAVAAKQPSYKIITIGEIKENIETKVQISEIVYQVKELENGNAYLNIGGVFPYNKLSLVIFKNDRVKFGDLKNYQNKLVKIKGKVTYYKGRPQIIINHTWQLQEI